MADHPRSPFTPIVDPPAHRLAEARARFEAGQADLAQMAREFGMALTTLKRRITHRWKWTAPKPRGGRAKPQDPVGRRGDARHRLNGSVRTVLKRELARLEGEFAALPQDGDIERTTRVLASLVRTLVALARLDGVPSRQVKQDAYVEQDTPVDLARLRNDLARRLGADDAVSETTADPADPAAA